MEAKIVFCVCHGPEKGSKYHLETVQTTSNENNNYYMVIFVKINFFQLPENASKFQPGF